MIFMPNDYFHLNTKLNVDVIKPDCVNLVPRVLRLLGHAPAVGRQKRLWGTGVFFTLRFLRENNASRYGAANQNI